MVARAQVNIDASFALAGAPLDVLVTVEVSEETTSDGIDVHFRGVEAYRLERRFHLPLVRRETFFALTQTFTPGLLEKGMHQYEVRFELPHNLSASFQTDQAEVSYAIEAIARVPFWSDGHWEVPVRLVRPEPPVVPMGVRRWASRDVPRGTEPLIELSLETNMVAIGSPLRGSVAVSSIREPVARVELGIAAIDTMDDELLATRADAHWIVTKAPISGETIHFCLKIPDRLVVSQKGRSFGRENVLFARAYLETDPNKPRPTELRVPIELFAPIGSSTRPKASLAVLGKRRSENGWRKRSENSKQSVRSRSLRRKQSGELASVWARSWLPLAS